MLRGRLRLILRVLLIGLLKEDSGVQPAALRRGVELVRESSSEDSCSAVEKEPIEGSFRVDLSDCPEVFLGGVILNDPRDSEVLAQ